MSLVTVEDVPALREKVAAARAAGRTVGFVPTMGALHAGHGSLVTAARARTDLVVMSIFVNPLQFGPNEDLDRYPRTLEADQRYLRELGCDVLFLPRVSEMYPEGFSTRVEMDGLTDVLCGRSRPGHFTGVLTVVLKLFNQVRPDLAFFGRKDFQQQLVIQRMVRDLDLDVEIVTCPIVREADGLALSSRNAYLSPEERAQAPALRRALLALNEAFLGGRREVDRLLAVGMAEISKAPDFQVDYLEIRHPETLEERASTAEEGDLVAVAARIGCTRLIDNLLLGEAT